MAKIESGTKSMSEGSDNDEFFNELVELALEEKEIADGLERVNTDPSIAAIDKHNA
jgi:hypothetical protein